MYAKLQGEPPNARNRPQSPNPENPKSAPGSPLLRSTSIVVGLVGAGQARVNLAEQGFGLRAEV